jgi:hypothetical protein
MTYHAAHTCSALWAALVPGLVAVVAGLPAIARLRGWGDS